MCERQTERECDSVCAFVARITFKLRTQVDHSSNIKHIFFCCFTRLVFVFRPKWLLSCPSPPSFVPRKHLTFIDKRDIFCVVPMWKREKELIQKMISYARHTQVVCVFLYYCFLALAFYSFYRFCRADEQQQALATFYFCCCFYFIFVY